MLKVLLVVGVLVPLALLGLYGVKSRGDAFTSAADYSSRQAAVMAEYAARVLDGHVLLIDVIEEHLNSRPSSALTPALLDEILTDHRPLSDLTVALMVMDPEGRVLANTLTPALQGRNFGDRDYYVRARASKAAVIGEQVTGRVTGQSFFTLSRALPDGRVIVVAIYCAAFERVFGTMTGGDGALRAVALFRADGKQLARFPSVPQPVILSPNDPGLMEYIPQQDQGVYRVSPKTGQGETLYAFRKIARYPLYLTYGIRVRAVENAWWRQLASAAVVAGFASLLIAGLAWQALRHERRAGEQEARLHRMVADRTFEADRRAAEAEKAHNAKSLFLASASHDLRQPVQGLRLSLDFLDQTLTGDADRKALRLAGRALEGLEDLLAALLDVSVLDSGIVRPQMRPVALNEVMAGLVAEFAPQAARQGIRLQARRCSAWVVTDPVLLSRMLRNLLSNALRYTREGGIVVGCRRRGDGIRIEVWDTGAGIPAGQLDSVFEDFVQLGNTERDRAKGLGLGLAAVRRMSGILAHPVGVKSRPGHGSVFWISVPRSREGERPFAPHRADPLHHGAAVADAVLVGDHG